MKSQFKGFISGVLTTALILGTAASALAISGKMTIEVDPVNIQVNGETFAPKDANGNPVPVFAYNGTTMAPLRALAEAYGLEVGYDAGKNMATVGAAETEKVVSTPAPDTTAKGNDYSDWSAEDEAAYQEFKGLWEIKPHSSGDPQYMVADYAGESLAFLNQHFDNDPIEIIEHFCLRMDEEIGNANQQPMTAILYWFNDSELWADIYDSTGEESGTTCKFYKDNRMRFYK